MRAKTTLVLITSACLWSCVSAEDFDEQAASLRAPRASVLCPPGYNIIEGTRRRDKLTGTSGNDCIVGREGNDIIKGMGGDDLIFGGPHNDTIYGGDGDDTIYGGQGTDRLYGDAGDDVIAGGDDDDKIYGGDGKDAIIGEDGDDRLYGDAGCDDITALSGSDVVYGGAGHDLIRAGRHIDLVRAGSGDDMVLSHRKANHSKINGDSGKNRCRGRNCFGSKPRKCGLRTLSWCNRKVPHKDPTYCPGDSFCDLALNYCVPRNFCRDDACTKTVGCHPGECDKAAFDEPAPVCENASCGQTGLNTCFNNATHGVCTLEVTTTSDDNCDGIDNDCNGKIDDGYKSRKTTTGKGKCAATCTTQCRGGMEVAACSGGSRPTGDADNTCNGVDDDCDGLVDEDFRGGTVTCGAGACQSTGTITCRMGRKINSCQPGNGSGSDTSCNGVDDDCDGQIDEDFVSSSTNCGVGACQSTGSLTCAAGVETNSCVPGVPAPIDSTCDGVDDDCDGFVDEDYSSSSTTCGVGVCTSTGATSCSGGAVSDSCVPGTPDPIETCGNNLDDDCDGAVDEGC